MEKEKKHNNIDTLISTKIEEISNKQFSIGFLYGQKTILGLIFKNFLEIGVDIDKSEDLANDVSKLSTEKMQHFCFELANFSKQTAFISEEEFCDTMSNIVSSLRKSKKKK